MTIRNYGQFISYINKYDIVPFSCIIDGWPSIGDLTQEHQWHTGDNNTDPWRWKDLAAERRDCAYGCILGGNKGFVSIRALPMYLAAVSPENGAEGMWREGLLTKTAMQVYHIIEQEGEAMIFDIRQKMGVSRGKGASTVDTALRHLQTYGLIVVSGSERRTNAKGLPYGWMCNRYMLMENWADAPVLDEVADWDRKEAKDSIAGMVAQNWNIDKSSVFKLFGF